MFMKKWGGLSYLNIRGLILEIRPKAYVYDRSGHVTHKVIMNVLLLCQNKLSNFDLIYYYLFDLFWPYFSTNIYHANINI
jgi:hypothetical protein